MRLFCFLQPKFAPVAKNNFIRISVTLIGLACMFAIIVAIYLYYNFKGKSNLSLMVPKEAKWVYHFQTKELRGMLPAQKPEYMDSLALTIKKLPIFKELKEATDVGIALYSDVVLFENDLGWHLLLKLNDTDKFTKFMTLLEEKNYVEPEDQKDLYTVRKSAKNTMWIIHQQKVLCIFVPNDTIADKYLMNKSMAKIFRPGHSALNEKEDFLQLFNHCQAYFYNNVNPSRSFGFELKDNVAHNVYLGDATQKPSPLKFFEKIGAGSSVNDVDKYLNENNELSVQGFFNEHFKTANNYLKPFTQ